MTVSLKHAFTTLKVDGGDATLVKPSNWNEEHELTCASNKVLGLDNSAPGPVIELPCTAIGRTIIGAADVAAVLTALGITIPGTGWIQPTIQTVVTPTWVFMDDGTIGNASSGGSTRANADTAALFAMLWAISVTYVAIFNSDGTPSTRGANAAADYAANKRIALPKALGRVLAASGTGSGLSARSLGQYRGTQTHAILQAELPNVTLTTTIAAGQGAHVHAWGDGAANVWSTNGGFNGIPGGGGANAAAMQFATLPAMSGTTPTGGSGTAHENEQPTLYVNYMVKL